MRKKDDNLKNNIDNLVAYYGLDKVMTSQDDFQLWNAVLTYFWPVGGERPVDPGHCRFMVVEKSSDRRKSDHRQKIVGEYGFKPGGEDQPVELVDLKRKPRTRLPS